MLLMKIQEISSLKDSYILAHQKRVCSIANQLAVALDLPEDVCDIIHLSALFHDVGKIQIPDEILLKPTKLIAEEWGIMKLHPVSGAEIIKNVKQISKMFGINTVVKAIRHHHERWDGTGYPDGLKGEGIPLEARILTIADCYDAITTTRIYRKAINENEALKEIRRCAGTQFDPDIAGVFVDTYRKMLKINSKNKQTN